MPNPEIDMLNSSELNYSKDTAGNIAALVMANEVIIGSEQSRFTEHLDSDIDQSSIANLDDYRMDPIGNQGSSEITELNNPVFTSPETPQRPEVSM